MPTWGVWHDGEQRFVVSCAPGARKARNLAERITDDARAEQWIERYVAKYRPVAPTLSADFLRQNLLFEITPDRVFAIIEREDEFATRATRWTF